MSNAWVLQAKNVEISHAKVYATNRVYYNLATVMFKWEDVK